MAQRVSVGIVDTSGHASASDVGGTAERVPIATLDAPRVIELPTGPLGIVFYKGRCQIAEVKRTSPLVGKIKKNDAVLKFMRTGQPDVKTNPMHDAQLSELLSVSQSEEGRKLSVASAAAETASGSCVVS